MKKIVWIILLVVVLIVVLWMIDIGTQGPGYFIVIENKGPQQLVYDQKTNIVYLIIRSGTNFGITPYMMRDSYGQLTVGIYNRESDEIEPGEPWYFDDPDEFIVIGGQDV